MTLPLPMDLPVATEEDSAAAGLGWLAAAEAPDEDLVLSCGCVPPCEGHHEDDA